MGFGKLTYLFSICSRICKSNRSVYPLILHDPLAVGLTSVMLMLHKSGNVIPKLRRRCHHPPVQLKFFPELCLLLLSNKEDCFHIQ